MVNLPIRYAVVHEKRSRFNQIVVKGYKSAASAIITVINERFGITDLTTNIYRFSANAFRSAESGYQGYKRVIRRPTQEDMDKFPFSPNHLTIKHIF